MNREHWKAVLPFVQAFAEGKTVEYKMDNGEWVQSRINMKFYQDPQTYRIVEPPELRPWKPCEVPVGCLVSYKHDEKRSSKSVLFHCNGVMIWTGFKTLKPISLDDAFCDLDHSTDGGKTWHPCGVIEGGAA